MGSMSNPNTWSPYDAYNDCSQQICSIYCPQWCYMIFSPPPPPPDYSAANLSPLIIALIGILATAFLLISYYAVVSKYCRRRDDQNPGHESESNGDHSWRVGPTGLDEVVIKSIAVCRYRKGDGLVEGTECAVCLSEFGEDESLRLLPNCSHAFHLPCIDAWLKSHSNCPLCRSTVACSNAAPPQPPLSQTPSALNISSLETQRRDDVVLVVDDPEMGRREEAAGVVGRELVSKNGSEAQGGMRTNLERREDVVGTEQVGVQQFRRSISLSSFSSRRQLLVADILRMGEEEDDTDGHWMVGRGKNSCPTGGMKRSVSTGRAMFVNRG